MEWGAFRNQRLHKRNGKTADREVFYIFAFPDKVFTGVLQITLKSREIDFILWGWHVTVTNITDELVAL